MNVIGYIDCFSFPSRLRRNTLHPSMSLQCPNPLYTTWYTLQIHALLYYCCVFFCYILKSPCQQVSQPSLTEAMLQRHNETETAAPKLSFAGKTINVNNRYIYIYININIIIMCTCIYMYIQLCSVQYQFVCSYIQACRPTY